MACIRIGKAKGQIFSIPATSLLGHGLITGATGAGKTNTLRVVAEELLKSGFSIFVVDVSGDVVGIANSQRLTDEPLAGFENEPVTYSTILWDVFGNEGHQVQTTIDQLGPSLTGELLNLSSDQSAVLNFAFRVAEREQLLLLDFQDLRAILTSLAEQHAEYRRIARMILNRLATPEMDSLNAFLGEPVFDVSDLIGATNGGNAIASFLDASHLIHKPRLYVSVMIWILMELERALTPNDSTELRLVVFFDEAHLLGRFAPRRFLSDLPRLLHALQIRGVGLIFVTANTSDMPGPILERLGILVRHGQHTLTASERRALAKADRGRKGMAPGIVVQLKMGEALISFPAENGTTTQFERVLIRKSAATAALGPEERKLLQARSPLREKYDLAGRKQANELLLKKTNEEIDLSTDKPSRFTNWVLGILSKPKK